MSSVTATKSWLDVGGALVTVGSSLTLASVEFRAATLLPAKSAMLPANPNKVMPDVAASVDVTVKVKLAWVVLAPLLTTTLPGTNTALTMLAGPVGLLSCSCRLALAPTVSTASNCRLKLITRAKP